MIGQLVWTSKKFQYFKRIWHSATETNMGSTMALAARTPKVRRRSVQARGENQASASRMKVVRGAKRLWDEESRVDYLTGFKKRKNERRKFGLAMQVMKGKAKRKC